jgi:hypothetical protein
MITIRPTQSLAKRMNLKLGDLPTKSGTVLGDWYAQDIVFEKKQFIFCMSEHGRLPLVMTAAPYAKFQHRLADQVLHLLLAIGVGESKAQQEWRKMLEFQLGKTDNRSVLGTMKQFLLDLHYANPRRGLNKENPLELSIYLTNMGTMTLEEFHPKDAVLKLFDSPQAQV